MGGSVPLRFAPAQRRLLALAVGLLIAVAAARADVELAPLFSDGVVLQQGKPVPVWGTASPGEVIVVSFAGQTRSATTGADGRWITLLDPLPAQSEGTDLVAATAANAITVRDVVVGEVWLCAGQSNMGFPVAASLNAQAEIAAANFPLVRHLKVELQTSTAPQSRVATSGWKPALPANVGDFTAVGYFFARDIHQRLRVPVGIINCSWGGTPIEAWMSPMALASDPAFAVVSERWSEMTATYAAAKADYDARIGAWTSAEAVARTHGAKPHTAWLRQNPKPSEPHGAPGDPWAPAGLFDGMINPLLPAAIRGVLWYQGEANVNRPSEYHALFSALITAWRAHFGQGDIPFFWVNLAAYRANDPSDTSFARLREAQTQTLSLPNTGQAIAIDIGDPDNIHPANKQDVGRRLALLAKHRAYGITVDDAGPRFAAAEREGSAMRVRFTDVSGGLVAQDRPPDALELAGADHVFHPATAKIVHETLIVTCPEVREPVAVRYAWRNAPDANLYSGNGLPVVPFRSDDW
jgi:sialate O-acetylesterase